MASFADKLRLFRSINRMSLDELADKLSTSKQVLSRYENETRVPKITTVQDYAIALGIPLADLLPDEPQSVAAGSSTYKSYTNMAWGESILDAYSLAVAPKQEAVCAVLEIPHVVPFKPVCRKMSSSIDCDTEPFSISDQCAAAGAGIYLGPEEFSIVQVKRGSLPHNAAFGVPVSGNSMEPKYHDGDILIVSKEPARINQIGVFTLGGQGFVKLRKNTVLKSLNPAFADIPLDEDTICNGSVIGVLDSSDIVEK